MTPKEREQVRLSILRYGLRPVSLGIILQNLRSEGFRDVTFGELGMEIEYLRDKSFMLCEPKMLSPENKLWRTTANGRDYLAEMSIE